MDDTEKSEVLKAVEGLTPVDPQGGDEVKTTIYNKAFDDAAGELEQSLVDREGLDLRIRKLRDAILALANMLDAHDSARQKRLKQLIRRLPTGSQNLTDAVLDAVYYASSRKLTAPGVRDHVAKRSPELAENPQLLAAIHSTLKRLERQGELASKTVDGETVYSVPREGPAPTGRRRLRLKLIHGNSQRVLPI